ncbi:collagen binding domain-containing protein, partial [Kallipyga massiliensis]|uniref:MSCRAMM family protein n=1 Tax=Kallipyga massiliensis TaxID=1472764 RepID=UPI0026EBCD5A
MKKFQRFLSFLLAALVIMTGLPIGSYAGESQAKSFHQGVFLAQGTKGSLPSLMELLGTQQNEERTSPPVRRSETHVSSPDIESTSAPAQESEEDRDSWDFFDRVGREMEKNAPDGAEALPVRRLLVNDKKALSSLSYQIHKDDDGLPQSITWILTYYVPQEKEIHQAAVVTNGDGLDQPWIYNREYTDGEKEAMEAREKDRADRLAKGESAPVFLYDTETKAVNRDGYALTTITTPIHRDNDLLKKIQEAKSGEEVDREKMGEVKRTLEEKVYSLTLVSLFGEEKITQFVQVQGDGTWVETDPLTTPIRSEWTGEEEKENRLLFAVPNMDKEEKAYVAPSFPTPSQAGDDTRILVYDLVPGADGFYDFRLVDQRSLDHYEKTLEDIQEEGLEGDALQEALDAATLKLEPGQFAVTLRCAMEKLEPVEEESPETSERQESASTGVENPSESKKPFDPETENRSEKPETPSLNESIREAEDARQSAEQTLDLLSLGRTLKEDQATLDELMQGPLVNLLQPMGAPLNPFVANRPIIIEVVDRDNKGVKIPGAVVRIAGPNMVREVTTGPDGRAVLENCNAGNYEVVQVSAPKGYMANQKKITFHFSAIETVKYVRIDDAKDYGTELYYIEGNVSDDQERSNKIAGVELELRAYENNHGQKGNRVTSMDRTAYTDANGYFVFNDLLPQYIYEVAVVKAPYEYAFVESTEPSVENGRVYTDIKFLDEEGKPIRVNQG